MEKETATRSRINFRAGISTRDNFPELPYSSSTRVQSLLPENFCLSRTHKMNRIAYSEPHAPLQPTGTYQAQARFKHTETSGI